MALQLARRWEQSEREAMTIKRMIRSLIVTAFSAAMSNGTSEAKNARAKEYNQAKQRLMVFGILLSTVSGALLLVSRIPVRISQSLNRVGSNRIARRSAFTI